MTWPTIHFIPLGIHELNIDLIEGQDRIDIDHEVLISYRGLDSMHGQNQGLCGPSCTVVRATLLIVVVLLAGFPLASGQVVDGPVVAEVFVSPNSAAYGGVDYNGDGEISRDSDQFIELHNPSATSIDLTGWQLDDLRSGGSSPLLHRLRDDDPAGWQTCVLPTRHRHRVGLLGRGYGPPHRPARNHRGCLHLS